MVGHNGKFYALLTTSTQPGFISPVSVKFAYWLNFTALVANFRHVTTQQSWCHSPKVLIIIGFQFRQSCPRDFFHAGAAAAFRDPMPSATFPNPQSPFSRHGYAIEHFRTHNAEQPVPRFPVAITAWKFRFGLPPQCGRLRGAFLLLFGHCV